MHSLRLFAAGLVGRGAPPKSEGGVCTGSMPLPTFFSVDVDRCTIQGSSGPSIACFMRVPELITHVVAEGVKLVFDWVDTIYGRDFAFTVDPIITPYCTDGCMAA